MAKESRHSCADPRCLAAIIGLDFVAAAEVVKAFRSWTLTADGKLWCPVHKPKVGLA